MVHPLLRCVWIIRKTILLFATPIILLPLPLLVGGQAASCGYVMLLIAVYWITGTLPIAVTALLPLVLLPILGVLPAREVSSMYFKDANWLLVGGLMIAVGVESSGLHRRIALRTLILVGARPKMLMLGFMGVTFFLSMWISNSATTAMMIPIAEAIMKELYGPEQNNRNDEEEGVNCEEKREKSPKRVQRNLLVMKGITICVPYAASIGGIATITGTPPNVVLVGQYDEIFPDATQKLSFGIWLSYCLPQATLLLILAHVWLSFWFIGSGVKDMCPCRSRDSKKTDAEIKAEGVVRSEYNKLGNISWREVTVLGAFVMTAVLWFFRDPGFMPGISALLSNRYISDATIAMTMVLMLFILPRQKPKIFPAAEDDAKPTPAILDWPTLQRMFPWEVPILVGGGFAMAGASTKTGLSHWFNQQIIILKGMDDGLLCFLATIFICILTEVTMRQPILSCQY